jgi:DNA-directed RNA polymerase subunit beta
MPTRSSKAASSPVNLPVQTFGTKHWRIFLSEPRKFSTFPDLLSTQKDWFNAFIEQYLTKLFDDINPIYDIAWDKLALSITDIKVSEPLDPVDICKKKELTYWGIISGKMKLVDNESNKILFNKRINIWILPLMTKWWSYIVNGVERVIISQMIRSYGIFFNYDKRNQTQSFKIIPERWSWIEVFTEKSWTVVVRVNNSRKFTITSLLRVFWFENDESIKAVFDGVFDEEDFDYIEKTLEKDTISTAEDAAVFIYNKMRPGEIIDPDSAMDYIKSMFLAPDRMYLGKVARRKINVKLWLDKSPIQESSHLFDAVDMIAALKYLMGLANKKRNFYYDDIDHLANRRIRSMGETLYAHLTPVMRKFVKSVRGKLSILNTDELIKLTSLANFKIIDNSIKSFFATSQLSQFLDQINPVAEIEHKRRITALGPGWLKRETATFEVRDVHQSHYGRICPIETPEWQNIGLVVHQALYSKVNDYWFIETPAVKVIKELPISPALLHRIADEDILDLDGAVIIKDWEYFTQEHIERLTTLFKKQAKIVSIRPYLSDDVEYISPEYDERYTIADLSVPLDEWKNIMHKRVSARRYMDMETFYVNDITHVDVNPSQLFSANTCLIPFVDHNDAVRASMGTNMQRQATPLVKPEAPLVGTGLEGDIAQMTYALVCAEDEGEVIYVDGKRVKVSYKKLWVKEYDCITFKRSNQKTVVHQFPRVSLGQKISKGDVLLEWPSIVDGEISLWKNLRVAFMPWEGYNYEDAIVISQRLVKDDELTSVYIDEYEIEVADTKLGPEETTNDIPWVSLAKLKNLDEDGVIRIWSTVKWGDILIGKISPKSEWELSPEEKLIHAIFGDKSKSFKDTSLYMPAWSEWKVVDVIVLDAKKWDNLTAWVRNKIKVHVAMTRKIEVGDKLAWRHGNKWIIAVVVPEEDMPFTPDGTPLDICLNPLWVIWRMNIGQVLEVHLGLVAKALGTKFAVPLFGTVGGKDIALLLEATWHAADGKAVVYDGRTWEAFDNRVTIGYMHILKLIHMVEDKIHARSVWPYSLITQQPLWGKAREWWQRFGEMEVWALEAYSAVYTLQEMLTIKSDDIQWRNKTYEAIVKWWKIKFTWIPESFNLVMYLFKGLGQNIKQLTIEEIDAIHKERVQTIVTMNLKGIRWEEVFDEAEVISYKDKEEEEADKNEIMNTVVEELKDHGDLDE